MAYLNNLKWMQQLNEFTPKQQKILLALSHDRYKWRTKSRLLSITGLPSSVLDSALAELISKDAIRPSFSKDRDLIFGLRERVG